MEDDAEHNFSVEFDPIRLFLVTSKKNEDNIREVYAPGSLARQTHLQILAYLYLFEYLKNNFSGFIYMPLLIMDSSNQTMTDENFEMIYPFILEFADEIGIQTIFLSKTKVKNTATAKVIDISSGLNKFHK